MAKVKCCICGKVLDYTKEQAVHSNKNKRRYSHFDCEPDGELVPLPESKEKANPNKEILDMVKEIFGDSANYPLVQKQIKRFQKEFKFTASGIAKTLRYYYIIKGNNSDVGHGGIGIVETEYQNAMNYYYSLYLAQLSNDEVDVKACISRVEEVEIEPPKPIPAKIKLFNLGED